MTIGFDRAVSGGDGPPPGGAGPGLPPGTYVERRDASGEFVNSHHLRLRPGHHRRSGAAGGHPAADAVHGRWRERRRQPLSRLRRARPLRRRRDRRRRAAERDRRSAEPAPAARVARHRRGARGARPSSPGWSCASASCRSTGSGTPPGRSPAATSRTASSPPTRGRRSGASGSPSTRCSTGSRTRSAASARARIACGASWPTPRTSCARRWPRSAATPSCSAWARRARRRTSRRRCAGSRTRRRAWACWSRTC